MTASAKPSKEKAAGDVHFRAGRYEEAIEQYTAALSAGDTSDPVYLNRCQALLKTSQFSKAEADATTVLSRQPNAKAFYRRGTARRELKKLDAALQDFKQALELDPTNQSIVEEISLVERQQKAEQAAARKAVKAAAKQDTPNAEKNRKLKAAVSSTAEEDSGFMKAVSTRRISEATSAAPAASFQAAKAARQTRLASVEPIQRARSPASQPSKSSQPSESKAQIQTSPESPSAPTLIASTSKLPLSTTKPSIRTAYDFTREWREAKAAEKVPESYAARWEVLLRLPEELKAVFQASLEPESVSEILFCLDAVTKEEPDALSLASKVLCSLPSVPRFDMIALFLEEKEQQVVRRILDASEVPKDDQQRKAWGV